MPVSREDMVQTKNFFVQFERQGHVMLRGLLSGAEESLNMETLQNEVSHIIAAGELAALQHR